MATKTLTDVRLRARVIEGIDLETGDPIYKNRNFNNVNHQAAPQQMLDAMTGILSLQKHDIDSLDVIDTSALTQD